MAINPDHRSSWSFSKLRVGRLNAVIAVTGPVCCLSSSEFTKTATSELLTKPPSESLALTRGESCKTQTPEVCPDEPDHELREWSQPARS